MRYIAKIRKGLVSKFAAAVFYSVVYNVVANFYFFSLSIPFFRFFKDF